MYVDIGCPLCGGNEIELVRKLANWDSKTKERFPDITVALCKSCGMVHQNPAVSQTEMERLYILLADKSFMKKVDAPKGVTSNENLKRMAFLHESLSGQTLQRKSLLEIGASNGAFLKLAQDKGAVPYGVEPSQKNADDCRRVFNIEVDNDFFENISFNRMFDIICHFFVLEHTFNPERFLRKVRELINPEGLMFLEVPSLESFVELPFAIDLFPYQHISHFYSETLIDLLKVVGFEVIDIKIGKQFSSKQYGMCVAAKPVTYQANGWKFTDNYHRGEKLLESYFLHKDLNMKRLNQRIIAFNDSFPQGATGVIFGAGVNGSVILSETELLQKVKKLFFIDNDPNLIGTNIKGIEVYAPDNIHDLQSDYVILASIDYQDDMFEHLLGLGYRSERILRAYD